MFQKFKITFYSLIVLLVLVLPSQAVADSFAASCKGWDCSHEGEICPLGAPGAQDGTFICANSKWEPIEAESCKGWNCSHEGQVCPQGAPGASDSSFICTNSKWEKLTRPVGTNRFFLPLGGFPCEDPVNIHELTVCYR